MRFLLLASLAMGSTLTALAAARPKLLKRVVQKPGIPFPRRLHLVKR